MNCLHHNNDTRANDMKRWRTTINVSLLRSQFSSSSSQLSVRRQCVNILFHVSILSKSAVNQDASINKDSKSSNSRSLRQHTSAKSISLCCLCFCFVLRNRSFHHTNLQISFASIQQDSQQDSHSRDRIYLSLLFSHIFFFRIYLFTSIASALTLSTLTMICHDIYISVNESHRNVDR